MEKKLHCPYPQIVCLSERGSTGICTQGYLENPKISKEKEPLDFILFSKFSVFKINNRNSILKTQQSLFVIDKLWGNAILKNAITQKDNRLRKREGSKGEKVQETKGKSSQKSPLFSCMKL